MPKNNPSAYTKKKNNKVRKPKRQTAGGKVASFFSPRKKQEM
jgi:hypothetical protein